MDNTQNCCTLHEFLVLSQDIHHRESNADQAQIRAQRTSGAKYKTYKSCAEHYCDSTNAAIVSEDDAKNPTLIHPFNGKTNKKSVANFPDQVGTVLAKMQNIDSQIVNDSNQRISKFGQLLGEEFLYLIAPHGGHYAGANTSVGGIGSNRRSSGHLLMQSTEDSGSNSSLRDMILLAAEMESMLTLDHLIIETVRTRNQTQNTQSKRNKKEHPKRKIAEIRKQIQGMIEFLPRDSKVVADLLKGQAA